MENPRSTTGERKGFQLVHGISAGEESKTCPDCGITFTGPNVAKNFVYRKDRGKYRPKCNKCRNQERRERYSRPMQIGIRTSDIQEKIIQRAAEIVADRLLPDPDA